VSKLVNKLLVLGGLTNNRHTMFKFSEPPGTSRDTLFNGLLDGTYKKAFLIEESEYRSMCFALDGSTQSEMRIDDPYALVNEYTRKMMGFLAFQPRPERVLIIGLGGGSLDRFDTLDRERQGGNPVGVDELHVAHAQESESSLASNVRERSLELLGRSDEPPSMLSP
jgi:hypothetical protein